MNTNINIPASTIVPCDDRCMFSEHEDCDCQCNGANHGKGKMLTPLQRKVLRTEAGRRIGTVVPGTPDYALAVKALSLREAGLTNRAIAAEMGVGAAKVRRLVRSLLVTQAIVTASAKKVAAAKEIAKARNAARVFPKAAAA